MSRWADRHGLKFADSTSWDVVQDNAIDALLTPRPDAGGEHHPADCLQHPRSCGYCDEAMLTRDKADLARALGLLARLYELCQDVDTSSLDDEVMALILARSL